MKKIVTVFMCLMLFLLLVSCAGNNTGTTTESSTAQSNPTDVSQPSTENSTEVSTSSSTSSSTNDSTINSTINSTPSSTPSSRPQRPEPTITEDKTPYKVTVTGEGDSKYIKYINDTFSYPVLTPYYNGYATALTMTFDDGYDLGTGTIISDQYEKYGFRGTMMLGPCFINSKSYIDGWNAVFQRGYLDVGCHGYNHKEPTTLSQSEYEHEIKDAIMFLREMFPGQRVLTYATPFAHINGPYKEYLSQFVIGNRLEEGGAFVNPSKDFDPYYVKAISVNKAHPVGSSLYSSIDTCIKYQNWMVELYHCVLEEAVNSTDIDRGSFEAHCEYLYRNYRDLLWITTFEDVLVYAEELKHITIEYTACDRESMTFEVTPDGTLDTSLYKIPVSMKVFLPNKLCDSAYALVNGEYQSLTVEIDFTTGYQYAIVRDIPVTSPSEVKVIFGGNKTLRNGCNHNFVTVEYVEPTHEEIGYTLHKCFGCDQTYKSKYLAKTHDFTGKEEVVIEATKEETGLSKFFCTQCDKHEVRETDKLAG